MIKIYLRYLRLALFWFLVSICGICVLLLSETLYVTPSGSKGLHHQGQQQRVILQQVEDSDNYNENVVIRFPEQSSTSERSSEEPISRREEIIADANGMCQPATRIFFLKTRKTASSAIQNMLMRYAETNNLTLMLPREINLLGYPFDPTWDFVLPVGDSHHYDIITHHIRYNKIFLQHAQAGKVIRFTILREPLSQLQSMWTYSGLQSQTKLELNVDSFSDFIKYFEQISRHFRGRWSHDMQNPSSFDLGLNIDSMNNETLINEVYKRISQDFDMVLIFEYLDESLILLKHLLCWDWEEVVVFRVNALNRKDAQIENNLDPYIEAKFYAINYVDTNIYKTALLKFHERVQQFGRERMNEEVATLRSVREKFFQKCVEKLVPAPEMEDTRFRPYSERTMAIKIKDDKMDDLTCVRIATTEDFYTQDLQNVYIQKYKIPINDYLLPEDQERIYPF